MIKYVMIFLNYLIFIRFRESKKKPPQWEVSLTLRFGAMLVNN